MSKDWLENLEKHLPPSVDHAIQQADHAIHDFALRVHLSHWHPISTAPCNQVVELRISEGNAILTLEFPCLQTNAGNWIDVDLGTQIQLKPVEWRIWQRNNSPQPHRSQLKVNDRSALLHHRYDGADQGTNNAEVKETNALPDTSPSPKK
jgi:hypothetical protein